MHFSSFTSDNKQIGGEGEDSNDDDEEKEHSVSMGRQQLHEMLWLSKMDYNMNNGVPSY